MSSVDERMLLSGIEWDCEDVLCDSYQCVVGTGEGEGLYLVRGVRKRACSLEKGGRTGVGVSESVGVSEWVRGVSEG